MRGLPDQAGNCSLHSRALGAPDRSGCVWFGDPRLAPEGVAVVRGIHRVIEAMSVGVPVISGLAPATREIGGDALLVIDPAAPVASIAETLDRLVREPRLRERSVEAGISRAQEFTWERTASRYLELYAEAAAS